MSSDETDTPGQTNEDAEPDPAADPFLNDLGDDIRALMGGDAEITIREYSDHVDIRVLPTDIKRVLEEKYDDVAVTPYKGFGITLQQQSQTTQQDESTSS